jgi:translation initiation factor IF-2
MIKTRVYEVARELGLDNRELVTKLATLGIPVRNHMSSIDPADADRVKRAIEKEKQQNVVEERIRPTVVRRRTVRRDDEPEVAVLTSAPVAAASPRASTPPVARKAPEVAPTPPADPLRAKPAAAPQPRAAEGAHPTSAKTAAPANDVSAMPPPAPKPAPVTSVRPIPQPDTVQVAAEPKRAPEPPPQPPPRAETRPQSEARVAEPPRAPEAPQSAPKAAVEEPIAAAPPAAPAPVQEQRPRPEPEKEETAHRPPLRRAPGPLPFSQRLAHSDLPPGVVARGNQVAAPVAQLSEAARSRIVSEHAARVAQQQGPAPRRRELVRSAIGPTGRQPQRGRPGRARKMAPGKKGAKPELTTPSAAKRVIRIEDQISLQVLAQRMSLKSTEVLAKLMQLGMMGVNINSSLDADTAGVLASEFGFEVENVAVSDDDMITEARGTFEDADAERTHRPPIVTVMGHVDHGKTSLLDYIRKTNVVRGESGGITQHLGAYRVDHKKGPIVFLDTPGHAAFTAMRARGAGVTDIVILVVAADDGVMPQTREAIHHAKAAKVPIVVAINKMDKPDARPEVVMRDLASDGLQSEDWGGDTQFFQVSAATGDGIDELLDGVLLQAEILELAANPNVPATGVVLESYLDKGRGPVANVLVRDGTLSTGAAVVAGGAYGKIRAMTDDRGKQVAKVGPSTPVEVLGLSEVPDTGDAFYAVTDLRVAQGLAERRKKVAPKGQPVVGAKSGLDALYEKMKEGETQELKLVVKADVQGSSEALVKALVELATDKVKVNVIHSGVGGITENDVMLASASGAIIIGFHVRPTGGASKVAKEEQVEIRAYGIIYEAVDAVKSAMVGLLKPTFREASLGRAEVRQLFQIPKGTIAGCFVSEGKIARSSRVRVVRDSVSVWEGGLKSLRRVKDDVREVTAGLECGVGLEGFNDLKERDVIECFEIEEVSASL